MEDKKKSFMDDAKGFFNAYKKDYQERNQEILDRKKKRDEEYKKLNEEIFKIIDEIKSDASELGGDLLVGLKEKMQKFGKALESGASSLTEKLELEKHLEQASNFFSVAGGNASKKFNQIADEVKSKLEEFAKDLPDEKKETNIDDIIKDAEDVNKKLEDKEKNEDKNISNLFS